MSNRLNRLLTASGHAPLDPETSARFTAYLALLQKWNARTNLTAIRDEESILSRHFLESILCRVPQVSLLRPGISDADPASSCAARTGRQHES